MSKSNFATNENSIFVSIIILNYNGGNVIMECLESVFRNTSCKKEIILVDNCSTDTSQYNCKKEFPEIILIQNNKNIGMTARNIGLKKAKGNFIVFLDSDTLVENNWLDYLIKSYKDHGEGLYQPKILEKERQNVISSCGNMINIFGFGYTRGRGEIDNGQHDNFIKTGFTAGACTFSSASVMEKIGDIDSIFFAYHDDVDYGWRAALLGIPSYFEPHSVIYHQVSSTLKWSKKKYFLIERNRLICLITLYSTKTLVKIFPLIMLVEIGVFLFFLKKGMPKTKINSYLSIGKLYKNLRERKKKISETRIYDDKTIIQNFSDDFFIPSDVVDNKSTKIFSKIITILSILARKIVYI